jgi:uncharacterized protein
VSSATVLTLANGKNVDLLALKPEDIDFMAFAEHLGKEARFNGATPNIVYSVAQHLCLGTDAMLQAGTSDEAAAYFLLHDCQEAIWRDDPTPKKRALADRIAAYCGIRSDEIMGEMEAIVDEHDAVIHRAAGLAWPPSDELQKTVKLYDAIMFVTEWRDLMGNVPHPRWAPFSGVKPLREKIHPWPWAEARAGWLYRAHRLLPALKLPGVAA